MKPILTTIVMLLTSIIAFGQTSIKDEEFQLSFVATTEGGRFVFNGKAHSFTIDVISDSIQTTDAANYILVDNQIVQAAIVALPPSNLDLSKLTADKQKQTLEAYVKYEMDYFKDELKLDVQNLKKEWVTIDSQVWLIWTFDVPKKKANEDMSKSIKSQIYTSTICFNQVLDLNMPIMQGDNFSKSKESINKLMKTLKLADKRM